MNGKNIETSNEQQYSIRRLKSYSIDEVLAAGGQRPLPTKLEKIPRILRVA
jgi:hypothetical protein